MYNELSRECVRKIIVKPSVRDRGVGIIIIISV